MKKHFKTGFPSLDEFIKISKKQGALLAIAARPSMGKTSLSLNIAQNVAFKSNLSVGIFSLELSREQLVQRMLCSETEIDTQKFKRGSLQTKDWKKLAVTMDNFSEVAIYIDDTAGCTITDLKTKCRQLAMAEKYHGLIIIDYLQLIECTDKDNRIQQISNISKELKILSKELNIPIIVLSQLSRAVEGREDKRPMLTDLRKSHSIMQDADIVIFIYRDEYYKVHCKKPEICQHKSVEQAELIIAYNKFGETGTAYVKFNPECRKFYDDKKPA